MANDAHAMRLVVASTYRFSQPISCLLSACVFLEARQLIQLRMSRTTDW